MKRNEENIIDMEMNEMKFRKNVVFVDILSYKYIEKVRKG